MKKINENYVISKNGTIYKKIVPFKKIAKNGRPQLQVTIDKKKVGLATLISEHLIDNKHNYTNICFKDDNPLNCEIDNIFWISKKQFYELRQIRKTNIGGRPQLNYDIESALILATDERIKDALLTRDFDKLWVQIADKIRISHFNLVKGEVYEYFIERMQRNSILGNPFVWVLKCSQARVKNYFKELKKGKAKEIKKIDNELIK